MLQRLVTRLALFLGALTAILANVAGAQQCCTGNVSTYCTAGTSVQGCVPQISGQGVPDTATGSGFDIVVGQMPGQRMGLIFYGMSAIPQPQPWSLGSSSYLCVYYPVSRTGARPSGGNAGSCNGELQIDFNAFMAANPSALGAPFATGQQFCAQGWYRDPGAAKGTNLSDALRFDICTNADDTTPPVITTCAANQTVSADANCQGIVPDFTSGVVASDNCTSTTITQFPAPGTTAPLGTVPVTIRVADSSANVTQCVTILTVADTIGPVITTCASNQSVLANSICQAITPDFTAGVVAYDLCSSPIMISQTPPAGSSTYLGVTSITIIATDGAGNSSSCAASLTVLPAIGCLAPTGFVQIHPGSFQMGEVGGAEPVHSVAISYPFWMGAREVTQAEYAAITGSNPSQFLGNANRPVERVSWSNARAYCASLTIQHAGNLPLGYQFRLPTEAEWEYACRAGTTTGWNVGNTLTCVHANHLTSPVCVGGTSPVGSYAPNAWGLYDMHGNVQEWCLDVFADYPTDSVTDPFVTGAASSYRIIRGGSWAFPSPGCRSAYRTSSYSSFESNGLGFRVVLGPPLIP